MDEKPLQVNKMEPVFPSSFSDAFRQFLKKESCNIDENSVNVKDIVSKKYEQTCVTNNNSITTLVSEDDSNSFCEIVENESRSSHILGSDDSYCVLKNTDCDDQSINTKQMLQESNKIVTKCDSLNKKNSYETAFHSFLFSNNEQSDVENTLESLTQQVSVSSDDCQIIQYDSNNEDNYQTNLVITNVESVLSDSGKNVKSCSTDTLQEFNKNLKRLLKGNGSNEVLKHPLQEISDKNTVVGVNDDKKYLDKSKNVSIQNKEIENLSDNKNIVDLSEIVCDDMDEEFLEHERNNVPIENKEIEILFDNTNVSETVCDDMDKEFLEHEQNVIQSKEIGNFCDSKNIVDVPDIDMEVEEVNDDLHDEDLENTTINVKERLEMHSNKRLQVFTENMNRQESDNSKQEHNLLSGHSSRKENSNDVIVISDMSDDEEHTEEQNDEQCSISVTLSVSQNIGSIKSLKINVNNQVGKEDKSNKCINKSLGLLQQRTNYKNKITEASDTDDDDDSQCSGSSEEKQRNIRRSLRLQKNNESQPEVIDLCEDSLDAEDNIQLKTQNKPATNKAKRQKSEDANSDENYNDIYRHVCVDDFLNFEQELRVENEAINTYIWHPDKISNNEINTTTNDGYKKQNPLTIACVNSSRNKENPVVDSCKNNITCNQTKKKSINSSIKKYLLKKSETNVNNKTQGMTSSNAFNDQNAYRIGEVHTSNSESFLSLMSENNVNETEKQDFVNNFNIPDIDLSSTGGNSGENMLDNIYDKVLWNAWEIEINKQASRRKKRCDCAAAYYLAVSKNNDSYVRRENSRVPNHCCMFRRSIFGDVYNVPVNLMRKRKINDV